MRRSVLLLLLFGLACLAGAAPDRPRLAVLTDIGGDPDDQQSLVRLMVYANEFRIEALIASSAGTLGELANPAPRAELISEIVTAYGSVRPHLAANSGLPHWPAAADLLATIRAGNPHRGRAHVGAGHDTDASRLLIERVDAGSPADPLNISVWGGQTDLAQAFWRVHHDRSESGWRDFAAKLRVYDVADQDGLADWIRATFPGLHYILTLASPGTDKRIATFRGMYLTGDEALTSRAWIQQHVAPAGALGPLYPQTAWTEPNPYGCLKEGDTPAWFFFLPAGGNDPADPAQPGWGGQFRREPDGWWRDLPAADGVDPRTTVSRWRPDFQADFARRLAWCRPDNAATR